MVNKNSYELREISRGSAKQRNALRAEEEEEEEEVVIRTYKSLLKCLGSKKFYLITTVTLIIMTIPIIISRNLRSPGRLSNAD